MDLKTSFLKEFEYETFLTRRILERIPYDHPTWKPHVRSMEIQELALHIATIPTWISRIVTSEELDLANTGETSFLTNDEIYEANKEVVNPLEIKNIESLLAVFDANTAKAIGDISAITNEELLQIWTMREGEKVFFSLPRITAIRNMAQNHNVHHRGQLSVYLRLLNIPLPVIYGSNADVAV